MKKRMLSRMLSLCLVFVLIISALPITVSAADGVKIDATNFPDSVFRSYVSQKFDLNGDLFLSSQELQGVRNISLTQSKVANLKGIEWFSNLSQLILIGSTKLTELSVKNNNLSTLIVSGCTSLKSLKATGGALSCLDASGCTALSDLFCNYNNLSILNVSGCTVLKGLYCDNNLLKVLNVSDCSALQTLNCENNLLESLDLSNCKKLTKLWVGKNQLTSLDVSKCVALTELHCYKNKLTHLDISKCTALGWLECDDNYLTAMDWDRKIPDSTPGFQTSSLEINGKTADLSKLVGTNNLNKVELKEGQNWQYNTATGVASYTGAGIPAELVYYYNGKNIPAKSMRVTVTLLTKQNVVMKQGAEKAYVNGIVAPTTQYASGYAKMENINGTMQLPLRYIAEVNGFTVNYDENTGKTRVTNPEDGTYLLITPNSTTVTKHTADGTQIGSSDTPLAFSIKNGVTMGPLRFTCEALGLAVSYQETSHGVYVVVSQEAQTDAYVNEKIAMAYWLGL